MLNASVNEELVASANVEEGDIVLEIGPGTGSLTNVIVNAGATVLAIEKVWFFKVLFILYFFTYICCPNFAFTLKKTIMFLFLFEIWCIR